MPLFTVVSMTLLGGIFLVGLFGSAHLVWQHRQLEARRAARRRERSEARSGSASAPPVRRIDPRKLVASR